MKCFQFLSLLRVESCVAKSDDQLDCLPIHSQHRGYVQPVVFFIDMNGCRARCLAGKCSRQWAEFRSNHVRVAHRLVEIQASQLVAAKPLSNFTVGQQDVVVAIKQRDTVWHVLEHGRGSHQIASGVAITDSRFVVLKKDAVDIAF